VVFIFSSKFKGINSTSSPRQTGHKESEVNKMQVSDSTFVCDSYEAELALEQQCDHDPKTVHHWCIDCCENIHEKKYPREWDDLD
jgi:hypothetical protein